MAATSAGYIGIIGDSQLDTFTVSAAGVISGGNWVIAGSDTHASTLSNSGGNIVYASNMVAATVGGSGTARPLGMALQTVGSGTNVYVAILRRGTLVCPANGTCTVAGNAAATYVSAGEGCVADATAAGGSLYKYDVIGQFYSTQTSGTNYYALLRLNL